MWHKAIWMGHPMRLELTRVGLLVELANHYTTTGALRLSGNELFVIFAWYTTLLPPVLDHSADYTNYGNSLPQPCQPPSNLSATAWGKNRSKVPSRESDHAQPCPTLWFFKSKADGPVWKEEGSLAAEDWTPKGYMYCRTQKIIIIIIIITPISAVDKKSVYKTSKLQMATKICGCDI